MRGFNFTLAALALFAATLTVSSRPLASPVPARPQLVSQLAREPQTVLLSKSDWAWLRERRSLTVGVVSPYAFPLDMIYSNGDYEGISADIVALLKQQWRMEINIQAFTSAGAAHAALESGEIDLISRASEYDRKSAMTVVSLPYAQNTPALYRRHNYTQPIPSDLRGLTVAVAHNYLPHTLLEQRYPHAQFFIYRSSAQAMAAVAYQNVHVYLGDTLSADYMINHSFSDTLKFVRLAQVESGGFGFLIRRDDQRLRQILNSTLVSFGSLKKHYLVNRWTSAGSMLSDSRVPLSAAEKRWLEHNPVARLIISDDMAPQAFLDADARLTGVLADIFDIINQRTGLRVTVERMSRFDAVQRALAAGDADLAILTPSAARQASLHFSRPFATSSFALVSASSVSTRERSSLDALSGKRLALSNGHVLTETIRRDYPDVALIPAHDNLDAMRQVVKGQADAALTTLSVAQYFIPRLYQSTLRVAGILDPFTATSAFAMRRGETELQSILDKALLSIAPDEFNAIAMRWRVNTAHNGPGRRDDQWVWMSVGGGALMVAMVWIVRLHRQLRRRIRTEPISSE